ncbi:MAG TPA: caleosin family protein [Polyangiaceae bacterium]|nr:caleosin family protein [Polyangiaceae bacterium]
MSDSEPLTPLERHVSYFDPDGDGEITMTQTFRGLRGVGVGVLIATLLTILINLFLGYLTQGKPSTRVSVRDIARGKHPFDTGSFDPKGEIDEANFAALFSGPTASPPFDRLTRQEIRTMIVKRGDPKKPFGELGSVLSNWFSGREIQLLLCVASDCKKTLAGSEEAPAISRRTLRRFYTGHLLFLLARRKRIKDSLARAQS